MIDIHSHFLPEIDDGAKSVSESIAMLVDSKKQGVEICIGTSHVTVHSDNGITKFLEKRKNSIEILEKRIAKDKCDVPELLYGAEVFLDNDVSLYDDISKLCIANTNYILVELSPLGYYPLYTEWLYSLTMKGFKPIVAHVERYPYLEQFLSELDGIDIICQMNARSILKRAKRSQLLDLYERGKKVIVSSDMHNMRLRKCLMKKAKENLQKKYPDIAENVFVNNAKEIFNI